MKPLPIAPTPIYAGLTAGLRSAERTSTLGNGAGGRGRWAIFGKQDYLRSDKKVVAYIKIKKQDGAVEYSSIYKENYKPIPSWAEKAMLNYPDGIYNACIFQRDERDDIETRLLLWYPNEDEVFFLESDYLGEQQ